MPTVTIPNVELISCGTWDASTGRTTVTPDDLAAAVSAYNDGLVDRPVIKIGHTDPRFAEANHDGNPAFGWVKNIRTSADGTVLLGDLVGIPAELGKIIPTAYPRRSIEMSWGVRTAAGKTYRSVVTGLALLGETAPAVKNLADIYALYSAGNQIDHSGWILVNGDTPPLPQQILRAADGQAMSSPAVPGGAMSSYPPKLLDALGLEAGASDAAVEAAVAASRTAPTSESVVAAPVAVSPAPAAVEEPLAVAASGAAQIVAAADLVLPPGMALVSQSVLDGIQSQLSAGVAARAQQDAERRDQIISTALSAGKLRPDMVPDWRAALEINEESTAKLLASQPELVHTSAFGSSLAPTATADTVTDEAVASFMSSYGLGSFVPKGI